jgi:hypothetical protein
MEGMRTTISIPAIALTVLVACGGHVTTEQPRDGGANTLLVSSGSTVTLSSGMSATGGTAVTGSGNVTVSGGSTVSSTRATSTSAVNGASGDGGVLPEAGSPACNMRDGECILCNDGNFHCGSVIYPVCPPSGVMESARCHDFHEGQYADCLACGDGGTATTWECADGFDWVMLASAFRCSQ